MLSNAKQTLLSDVNMLKELLEYFGFCNVRIRDRYISFGRDINSSPKSIVIRTENNDNIYVIDYAKNINKELISFIMITRGLDFKSVLVGMKHITGIEDFFSSYREEKTGIFGGIYDKIKRRRTYNIKIYDDSVLDDYEKVCNIKFLKDNISLESQRFFNIGYCQKYSCISIPIYDPFGNVMGVKLRRNYDDFDGEKYFYDLPCMMSQTLYGYCQNYSFLTNQDVLVFESEKSVMQCFSYGIRNCVALGSGSVSQRQIQLIYSLSPNRIVLMHDYGYDFEAIKRNADMIEKYAVLKDTQVWYWNYTGHEYEEKFSPSDLGKAGLMNVINNELALIHDVDEEEL